MFTHGTRISFLLYTLGTLTAAVLAAAQVGADSMDRNVQGTILFATVGRAHYGFDVFALTLPGEVHSRQSDSVSDSDSVSGLRESRLTDGVSVNYNAQLVEGEGKDHLLQWLTRNCDDPADHKLNTILAANNKELMLYVSERDGTARIYVSLLSIKTDENQEFNRHDGSKPTDDQGATSEVEVENIITNLAISGNRGFRVSDEGGSRRILLQCKFSEGQNSGSHLQDRPQVGGRRIIYVSTEHARTDRRQSWSAVYSASLDSSHVTRLTPEGVSDFSPTVSPSGEWVVVASLQEKGWQGEIEELNTDLYILSAEDGSQRKLLARNGGWPTWAGESTVYFHRKADDGWWSIFKVTLAEGSAAEVDNVKRMREERVTPPGVHAFTPSASKAGDWIAVATRRPESDYRHIEIYDLSSKVFIRLTERVTPYAHHYNPSVSQFSKRILYHRCRGAVGTSSSGFGVPLLQPLRSPVPGLSLLRVDGSFPSFSPDGSMIAYIPSLGLGGVNVTSLKGKSAWQVYSGKAFGTAWDRRRRGVIYVSAGIGFSSEMAEVHIVSIANVDGEGDFVSKQLSKKGTGNNAFPSPSPDGKYVVFRSGRTGHKNLYIMDAVDGEEKELRRLTDGAWTDTMANWSPTGEWIAFSSDRENPGAGHFSVFLIRPDGTGLRKILSDGGRVNHPHFSPDGKSLVFTSDFAAVSAEPVSVPHQFQPYGEIFIARIDGSEVVRLTHDGYEDGTPAWGPIFIDKSDLAERGVNKVLCDFDDVMWLKHPVSTWCM